MNHLSNHFGCLHVLPPNEATLTCWLGILGFITAVGHASALVATALGVGVTLVQASPVYGLTLAWALSACADGINKRPPSRSSGSDNGDDSLAAAAMVQQKLCWTGALACAAASLSLWIF